MATEQEIRMLKKSLQPYSHGSLDLDDDLLSEIIDSARNIKRVQYAQYGLISSATMFPLCITVINSIVEHTASDDSLTVSAGILLPVISAISAFLGLSAGALKLCSQFSMKDKIEASLETLMFSFPSDNRAAAETFILKKLGINGIITANGSQLKEENEEEEEEEDSGLTKENTRLRLSTRSSKNGFFNRQNSSQEETAVEMEQEDSQNANKP